MVAGHVRLRLPLLPLSCGFATLGFCFGCVWFGFGKGDLCSPPTPPISHQIVPPSHLKHPTCAMCTLAELLGASWAIPLGAHAAVFPMFEAVEDGRSKRRVLRKTLAQAPQAHAFLPTLVPLHEADEAKILPAHHDTIRLQQNKWRTWHGGKK